MKTIIIAEAGVNHNGDLNKALELVKIAAKSGADYVKFQTAIPELVVTKNAVTAEYQKKFQKDGNQLEMTKKIHLKLEDFDTIHEECKRAGIKFLSTAFDLISLEYLSRFNMDLYKIPSGEITNLPYLKFIGRLNKRTVLSTGMSNLSEIGEAIDALQNSGLNKENLTVLHCNTEYPTPMCDVNLLAMLDIKEKFNVGIGYSDHTMGIEVPIAATAMGAEIIEKHFTLDKNLEGPDHAASLSPEELIEMVKSIRNIESALGNKIKKVSPSEEKNKNIARRSIVAFSKIFKGEPFSEQNLIAKRPGNGISPMEWDNIIGKIAKRDFDEDELIEL